MTKIDLNEEDTIKSREVGDPIPELEMLDPGLNQFKFSNPLEYVEFAKLMCQAEAMLPDHAKRNPSICMAIAMRAAHWGNFDPYALAQESFQAKPGGPIGFMAKVFSAVMRKNGIILQYRYEGTFEMLKEPFKSARGNVIAQRTAVGDRKCIVSYEDQGILLEYETPKLDDITIKNSALWHNDPDQQLGYYAVRGWARRHRSDLMLGAYSDDEVRQIQEMKDVTPKRSGFAELGQKARQKSSEEETDKTIAGETVDEKIASDDVEGDEKEVEKDTSEIVVVPDSPAFIMGMEAAAEGFIRREEGPFSKNDEAIEENTNWIAGFDSVEGMSDDT